MSKKRPARRIFKGFAILAAMGVLGIGALLALLWIDHNRETTLPMPTGPFAVGRTTYVWSDAAHEDPMAPQPGTKRELLAWIWYPAAPQQLSQTVDDYIPAAWRTALDRQRGVLIRQFLTRDLSRVHAHSIRDAEVSPQSRSYPVVFMRAGLAALTIDYTTLAEDLASHGYVVVGFDAPYRSWLVVLPNGRVIARAPQNNADLLSGPQQEQLATKLVQTWSADMSFALDRLEQLNTADPSGKFRGRLDMQRVGVFGHSLGGATALQFCHVDSRCKAGIDVDGAPLGSVIQAGLHQPFMFILSDHSGEPDSGAVMANIQAIYNRLPVDGRLSIAIHGANHFLFSDDGALLKSHIVLRTLRMFGILGIDGRRQLAVTAYCVHSFFDAYLKRGKRFATQNLISALPRDPSFRASVNDRGEMTSQVNRESSEGRFHGRLRAAALIAVLIGAAGSVGFMLRVGRRNNSRILLVLFTIWVLSPFLVLAWASLVSKRWSVLTRTTLYSLALILTLGSLTVYGYVALTPPRAKVASVFLVTPLASWLLIAIGIPVAAFISGRLSNARAH